MVKIIRIVQRRQRVARHAQHFPLQRRGLLARGDVFQHEAGTGFVRLNVAHHITALARRIAQSPEIAETERVIGKCFDAHSTAHTMRARDNTQTDKSVGRCLRGRGLAGQLSVLFTLVIRGVICGSFFFGRCFFCGASSAGASSAGASSAGAFAGASSGLLLREPLRQQLLLRELLLREPSQRLLLRSLFGGCFFCGCFAAGGSGFFLGGALGFFGSFYAFQSFGARLAFLRIIAGFAFP